MLAQEACSNAGYPGFAAQSSRSPVPSRMRRVTEPSRKWWIVLGAFLAAAAIIWLLSHDSDSDGGSASASSTQPTPSPAEPTIFPNPTLNPKPRPKPKPKPGEAPSKFTGVQANNYEIAYQVCGVFGLRKTAQDLHVKAEPVTVADAYADDYRPGFQQAPFEGCLDALLDA
jgi:hypothetical protein